MEGLPASVEWSPEKRAAEPFVFRSGGFFGSGKVAHTIGAAVRHMDRHPDDGIYHLQNGTLAQWLESQEAQDLAYLAHQVATAGYTDRRVMVETFLLGTGLVSRPRLSLRPKSISLGYVLAGQTRTSQLQVSKGRGRGYLFGRLHSSASCLSADPMAFGGGPCKVRVSVDSEPLSISQALHQLELLVESSASAEPVVVPVRLRVMGMPSWFDRFMLRPLAGIIVAGFLGLGLGALLGLAGAPALASFWAGTSPAPTALGLAANAPLVWAIAIGIFWAVLGGIAGLLQPPAYPVLYATGVRLLRTLVWAAALAIAAAAVAWAGTQIRMKLGMPDAALRVRWSPILLGVVGLAIVPAMIGEVRNARLLRARGEAREAWSVLRPALLVATTVAVCVLLVAGVWISAPAVQRVDTQSAANTAQTWLQGQLMRLDSEIGKAMDQFYLRYYDRRAPLQPPAGTPSATGTPQTEKR